MRLTADILLRADSYLNAVKDRELNLRGFKIANIENFAVLEDQHDTIDLSDNELKKLDNFPLMNRLQTLLLNNNYISRIDISISNKLINLNHIILTNNKINNFIDIYVLSKLPKLATVVLLENPIIYQSNYRNNTLILLKQIKILDYIKINSKEKDSVTVYSNTSNSQIFLNNLEKQIKILDSSIQIDISIDKPIVKSLDTIENSTTKPIEKQQEKRTPVVLTDSQREQIKQAINLAKTKEEVDLIEKQLLTGTFPFKQIDAVSSNGIESTNGSHSNVDTEVINNENTAVSESIVETIENSNETIEQSVEQSQDPDTQDDDIEIENDDDDDEKPTSKSKGKAKKTPAKGKATAKSKTPSKPKTPAKTPSSKGKKRQRNDTESVDE